MDNNALLAMLPQLLEAQRDFFASQTVLVNMLIDERKDKQKVAEEQSNKNKTIKPIKQLTMKQEFFEWRSNLFDALKMAGLENHILRDTRRSGVDDDYDKWVSERAEVDFFIQNSVYYQNHRVWDDIAAKGWDSKARNPKATFDKLTEYCLTP